MQPLPGWFLQQQYWSSQLHKLLTRCVYITVISKTLPVCFIHNILKSVGTCLDCCPQVSIRPIRVPLHVHHVHWELSASKLAPAWMAQGCLSRGLSRKRSLSTITYFHGCVCGLCLNTIWIMCSARYSSKPLLPDSALSLQQLFWLCSVSDVSRRNRSSANCC